MTVGRRAIVHGVCWSFYLASAAIVAWRGLGKLCLALGGCT